MTMTDPRPDLEESAPAGGLVDLLNTTPPPAPAPARRQPGVEVLVYVEGQDPFTVRITNRERIAYEKAAARHKEWPALERGRNFAMTHHTWTAARRAGRTSLTFDQWADVLEDFDAVEDTPADPTQ